jgi:hypothetical protein
MERREDLARRADAGEGIVIEPAAERLLAAQVQFHPREAVDAEVLDQPAVERHRRRRSALRLGRQRPQQIEQQARVVCGLALGCGGLTKGLGHLVSFGDETRNAAGGNHRFRFDSWQRRQYSQLRWRKDRGFRQSRIFGSRIDPPLP